MSHFQDTRSEFVLAGSKLQAVGAIARPVPPSFDAVSLNVPVLRFGIFELDPQTLELRREGRLIHLRHQPARVLSLLLERSGRLVSREEITNELWPSDVDVDVEQGLNHCIKEIRAALGDRSEAPRYIQTLPRRGYRVLVEVHRVREKAPDGAGSAEFATVKPEVTPPEALPGPRPVRIAISISRAGEPAPLWSTTLEGFAHDLETVERNFQAAFRSGLRPVLLAEASRPADREDDSEALPGPSRRGFE